MNLLLYLIVAAYIVGLVVMGLVVWSDSHAPKQQDWWTFVEQSAMREKKADMQRKFPVFRPNIGGWKNTGYTTIE